jgi:hypothetical protein
MGNALRQQERRRTLARRLAWFMMLWGAGVGALAAAAWLLKAVMLAAGMR